jgi:hypothetical protein
MYESCLQMVKNAYTHFMLARTNCSGDDAWGELSYDSVRIEE